jgi:hypothetical protein
MRQMSNRARKLSLLLLMVLLIMSGIYITYKIKGNQAQIPPGSTIGNNDEKENAMDRIEEAIRKKLSESR